MNKIKNHVDDLFKDIPKSEEKEIIKQEIFQNLEEKVYDLMAHGKEEEDAVNKAIVEFGNIDEIKNELGVYNVSSDGDEKRIERAKIDLNFSIWGSILFIALMVFINLYYSPSTIWFVYPTFAILWWPLSMFYRWRKLK
ncbi:permease prefix domain 1-containing protein [Oceanobacillus sojae]|uniref:permease prefix domain 1-containing protein n=1 Tax=Oceanobacillus sojae TaxID=582851 RepID=UPI0009884E7A|nr:permease prefix domain 1-containing protein [Oceanobacillus sojae]